MSFRLMTAVFDIETLGPTERLLMLALAEHADDDGRCYPSNDRLCRRTGLSERTVRTNLRKLESAGYIRSEIGGGRSHSNFYTINTNPAASAPLSEAKGARDAPLNDIKGAGDAGKGAGDAPEPVMKQSRSSVVRERARDADAASEQTHREALLAAVGADPVSGLIGPNGTRIGTVADMAEVAKWTEAGISEADQVRIVAERMAQRRAKVPGFAPKSLRYFSDAMSDFAARRDDPLPQASPRSSTDSEREKRLAFYRQAGRRTA